MPWPFPDESWSGFDYTGEPDRTVRFDYLGLDRSVSPRFEPQPTHEERVERCELMGMVFCNCSLKDGHVVVYNPTCPVHNLLAKLSR